LGYGLVAAIQRCRYWEVSASLLFVLASHFLGSGSGSKRISEVGSIRQHEGQALLPGLEREEAAAGSKAVLD
jgi:hypothetical protein